MRSDCVGGQLTSKPLVPCFEKTNKQTKNDISGRLRAADYDKKLKLPDDEDSMVKSLEIIHRGGSGVWIITRE